MHNVEGMKKGRLCKTAFAAICESKEGSKSLTDPGKISVCSELKSSISSISSTEDIEEMADFGTEPHSFKFSVSATWTQDQIQGTNSCSFHQKFANMR